MVYTKDEFSAKVGYQIRKLRLERQLSIEKLALEAGMEYTQVSRIELGRINTSIYQIYKISESLDVTIPEIFFGIQGFNLKRSKKKMVRSLLNNGKKYENDKE